MEENRNEQAVVEVTVELDKETYFRFGRFAWVHWPQNIAGLVVLFVIFPIALILLYAAAFTRPSAGSVGMVSGGSAFYLYVLVMTLTSRRRAFRKIEQQRLLPQTFTFYEAHLQAQGGAQFVQGSEQMQYELFNKVYETKHAFYMVFIKQKVFMLDKKFFGEAETAALRALFARRFGEKFKQYSQK
jgi:hypothetical protein